MYEPSYASVKAEYDPCPIQQEDCAIPGMRVLVGYFIALLLFCSGDHARGEYDLYLKAGARCKGAHAKRAARVAFEKYANWKEAYDEGLDPPPRAFQDAGQAFQYLVKNGCKDGLILYRYGNLLRHNKKCKKAIEYITMGIDDLRENYPGYMNPAYYAMAYCSTNLGNYDDSIRYYNEAIKHDPNDVNSRINLCRRYYWAGQKEKAYEAATYVLEKMKDQTSSFGKGICFNTLGWLALDSNKVQEAIENFRKAYELRQRPSDVEGLAWAYEQIDPDKADEYWERLVEFRSQNTRPRLRKETEERLKELMTK
jgi:tetratricopeptide (TPR) repeat protein